MDDFTAEQWETFAAALNLCLLHEYNFGEVYPEAGTLKAYATLQAAKLRVRVSRG